MVNDQLKDIWDKYDETRDGMRAVATGAHVIPGIKDFV